MANDKNVIMVYADCIRAKSHNRRLLLRPSENGKSIIMQFSILDGDTTFRSVNFLSHKNKVVNTGVMINKNTAEILYKSLGEMLSRYDYFHENYPKKDDSEPTK